jgi:hypothetical protein
MDLAVIGPCLRVHDSAPASRELWVRRRGCCLRERRGGNMRERRGGDMRERWGAAERPDASASAGAYPARRACQSVRGVGRWP